MWSPSPLPPARQATEMHLGPPQHFWLARLEILRESTACAKSIRVQKQVRKAGPRAWAGMRAPNHSPGVALESLARPERGAKPRREVLGLDDGDRDVVDHQMASRVNAAALEDAREDPRLIRRWLPPAESGAALLRNGGRGSFALGYCKM